MRGLRQLISSPQGLIDHQSNGVLGISFNDLNRDLATHLSGICRFFIPTNLL